MNISNFIVPLSITLFIECITAFLAGYREKRFILVLILVNVITNPVINYIMLVVSMLGGNKGYYTVLMILESAAVLSEWKLLDYTFPGRSRSFLILSVVMNSASYLAGLFINKIGA